MCLPEYKKVFPTRRALWRSDVFDPLKRWINETLASGEMLVMNKSGKGSTWARIVPRDWKVMEDGGRAIPLRPRSRGHGSSVRGTFTRRLSRGRVEK